MSHTKDATRNPNANPQAPDPERRGLENLCTSIRGKLQFMDYLVRAAVADVERFGAESDPGARVFLKQLIEMHADNLARECDNMRLLGDLCANLHATIEPAPANTLQTRVGGAA